MCNFLCCILVGVSRGGEGGGGEDSSTWTISSERNQGRFNIPSNTSTKSSGKNQGKEEFKECIL